jgi:hypothetical protein
MHWRHKVNYKIEVFNIKHDGGYYGGIDGILQKDATSESLSLWFHANKHSALPNPESTDALVRNPDLDTYFVKVKYDNLETAKTTILHDSFLSILASNCWNVDYFLREGNLIISCFFENDSKANTVALAIANGTWSKVDGAVHSTIATI